MPALSPSEIVAAVIDGFAESGAAAYLVSSPKAHPRRFVVDMDGETLSVWVYVWTLTHGGGAARPEHEYRIQLTGVTPPLPLNPDGLTVLLGYEPNMNCFVGFDMSKHKNFSKKSPSIQVDVRQLPVAISDGFAYDLKHNGEFAIAFRPDNLLNYCVNGANMHALGKSPAMMQAIQKVSQTKPGAAAAIQKAPKERQKILKQIWQMSRDSSFGNKVKVAYDKRCAVTGVQLRLLDAAHILPVGITGSTDDVPNGLCLSPTYHRAYDHGLIYLTTHLEMKVNPARIEVLKKANVLGGLAEFSAPLDRPIILPADKSQRPDLDMVKAGNVARKIA